jgi:4-aminobutyrate aminotransferase/(S)-3-amino-2-methylpropionate transaminase
LGQTGADAVSGALKTAVLYTGRPGVVAFGGAYHGLSNGPLAVSSLRESYKKPFAPQLNPHVSLAPYPQNDAEAERAIEEVERLLSGGQQGAILVEPVLGRGGVIVPPMHFLPALAQLAQQHGALLIADEVWTGLGRAGRMLFSQTDDLLPDIICLGKGLGGGLPISAILGKAEVMAAWSRDEEVVETSTFAGAPLACSCALALLGALERHKLVARSAEVGARFKALLSDVTGSEVRGAGLMLGLPCDKVEGGAVALQRALLERGYLTSTGGGARDVLVLTPALNIDEGLLEGFCEALRVSLRGPLRPR